jgi:hypothetical protein
MCYLIAVLESIKLIRYARLIGQKSQTGCTALFAASETGYGKTVTLLLERGANVNIANTVRQR